MKDKKVRFNNRVQTILFTDDAESANLRKAFWEIIARDQQRFRDRISQTEECLAPVLRTAHRVQIFNQRFKEQLNLNMD